ncbi:hypothetical protein [Natronobacterium gregoryi]|uniref:Uncharacterized protein n=2 Tax=Natronobacterium gregoryi TaxID=44930 RepID=L0AF06_NATGS|nr:hypothetical protein [Natronobacterium gregoryi]AFZ71712.1 hypothetical protein Natgr_0457 [Natronobacterium gregoryi SP2]ELY72716.1 hypothetical protein C490_02738 [Natronobacterium gregoryi SP2]PLK20240.1 hypothetical protein CYV19_10440 [Natronobacterium gregoryi SP2]SFJ26379.1 hypothetical protein SAMN05443661_11952 [Natronobacterium gregoryi]
MPLFVSPVFCPVSDFGVELVGKELYRPLENLAFPARIESAVGSPTFFDRRDFLEERADRFPVRSADAGLENVIGDRLLAVLQ